MVAAGARRPVDVVGDFFVDAVRADAPPRVPAEARDRDAVDRDAVPRPVVLAVPADRRVDEVRRPEAAVFDFEVDAADPRAVDLGLMTVRINRNSHRSPVHLTGHTGGVSVS
ncbi:hypothetical protein GCM10009722_04210 [Williamsia deligens]|nr:hypothetical protein [Williamsia deligens]